MKAYVMPLRATDMWPACGTGPLVSTATATTSASADSGVLMLPTLRVHSLPQPASVLAYCAVMSWNVMSVLAAPLLTTTLASASGRALAGVLISSPSATSSAGVAYALRYSALRCRASMRRPTLESSPIASSSCTSTLRSARCA